MKEPAKEPANMALENGKKIKDMTTEERREYDRVQKALKRAGVSRNEYYRANTLHFNTIGGNGGVKAIPPVTVPLEVPEVSVWSPKSVEHAKGAWQRMAHALHFAPPTIAPVPTKGPSVRIRLQEIPARPGVTSIADEDYRAKRNALQNAPSTRLVETAEQLGLKVEVAEVLASDMKVSGRIPSVRIMNGVKRAVENAVIHLQVQDYRDPAYRRGTDASDAWQGRVLRYSPETPKWDGVTYCIRRSGTPKAPTSPEPVYGPVDRPHNCGRYPVTVNPANSRTITMADLAYAYTVTKPFLPSALAKDAVPVYRHGVWFLSILPLQGVR